MRAIDTQSLKSTFQGQLLEPGDTGYDDARRIWNASIDKHPKLIARCTGNADVIAAIDFARANDLLTAIRGGGHNVGGRALCDDGMVIDLSRMRSVHVDAANRRVRVQGGATLGDLDRETHIFGLAVPSGRRFGRTAGYRSSCRTCEGATPRHRPRSDLQSPSSRRCAPSSDSARATTF